MSFLASLDARAKLVFLAVFMLAALHARTAIAVGFCVGIAVVLAVAVRLDMRTVRAAVVPLVPILLFTVFMQALCVTEGNAVFSLGGLTVTEDALRAAIRMVACLFSLVLASVSFMRCTAVEELLSVLRWLLTPLRALGVRTDAFVLSVSVALGFAPVLVGEFNQLRAAQQARSADFDGPVGARVQAYGRLFAPLLRSSFKHAETMADAFLSRGFSCGAAPTQLHPGRFGAREVACLAAAAIVLGVTLV